MFGRETPDIATCLRRLESSGVDLRALVDSMRAFPAAAARLRNAPRADSFRRPQSAAGIHGLGHTLRTMLWAHLLASLNGLEKDVAKASLAAALVHDMGRRNDGIDEEHGTDSLCMRRDWLWVMCSRGTYRDACVAVQYHSRRDSACPDPNLVWKTLKDADALDRGRLGRPNTFAGCDASTLRLPLWLNGGGPHAAWLAWYFVEWTQGVDWNAAHDPYFDLLSLLRRSLGDDLFALPQARRDEVDEADARRASH